MNFSQTQDAVGTTNELARHAWVQRTLRRITPGSRILDAGAGTQRYRSDCTDLKYFAQDFGQYDGAGDGKGLHPGSFNYGNLDIISDIISIPCPDASFDAVLCTEVLEHVKEPHLAIREISRLVRPGGCLVLTAPFISFSHFTPYHFCTGFSRYYFEAELERNGWQEIEISFNGGYFDVVAQELRRLGPMASKYSGVGLGYLYNWCVRFLLHRLEHLRRKDEGSSNFACFGVHVFARKKP